MHKRSLTGGVIVWALASVAAAGPYEDGAAAYRAADYATALALWRPLAKEGDARAQFRLGVMYDNAVGVPRDDAQAAIWYRRAGDGGETGAQLNLGFMYWSGEGVAQDSTEAIAWWRRAAENGHAIAQYFLGYMHDIGDGVPRDLVLARVWFGLAARQGHGLAIEDHAMIARRMTGDQIAEAESISRTWLATHDN